MRLRQAQWAHCRISLGPGFGPMKPTPWQLSCNFESIARFDSRSNRQNPKWQEVGEAKVCKPSGSELACPECTPVEATTPTRRGMTASQCIVPSIDHNQSEQVNFESQAQWSHCWIYANSVDRRSEHAVKSSIRNTHSTNKSNESLHAVNSDKQVKNMTTGNF